MATGCSTGYEELKSIYKWPGTLEGNANLKGIPVLGKSTTGTEIAARAAVEMNSWKGSHFCAAYVKASEFVRKDKDK
jgi:hypothetical protein